MGNVTTSSNFRSAPTFAELNTGLAGMLSAGLIEREADRLRITMVRLGPTKSGLERRIPFPALYCNSKS